MPPGGTSTTNPAATDSATLELQLSENVHSKPVAIPVNLMHTPTIDIVPVIASVAQLMRIPVSFSNLKAQALVDTGAAASFLAHRLFKKIPYGKIKIIEESQSNMQLFKTVSGELVKPLGRFEIRINLAKKHPFTHTFYVISELDEGCILDTIS